MPKPPPKLRYCSWKPSALICLMKPHMMAAASRKMLTSLIVLPRWQCTPARFMFESALMASRNQSRCALRMPNLLLAMPVEM